MLGDDPPSRQHRDTVLTYTAGPAVTRGRTYERTYRRLNL